MGRWIKRKRTSELDEVITKVLLEMNGERPDSDAYKKQFMILERLYRLRSEERKDRVNPNTVVIVAGNIIGILIIVVYEQKHVVISKALGFVIRTNVPHE